MTRRRRVTARTLRGNAVCPAVLVLGPPGRAVAQGELDRAGQSEVFEVPARGAAADTRHLGELDRRHVGFGSLQRLDDRLERWRGDALGQSMPTVATQEGEDVVDVML